MPAHRKRFSDRNWPRYQHDAERFDRRGCDREHSLFPRGGKRAGMMAAGMNGTMTMIKIAVAGNDREPPPVTVSVNLGFARVQPGLRAIILVHVRT